ncbi:hypothetical protein FRC0406_02007 [Corynebacterium diphtheriae]|nr:hypothetical protein FRC0406_02007 [Corynebacterium diphtheriae]
MVDGVHFGLVGKRQAVLGVDLGRLEQLLTQGAVEFFHVAVERQTSLLQQYVASQGVAVGVQTRRCHSDDNIAVAHTVWAENLIGFNNAHGGCGNVIMLRLHHTWVLCGFATEQCATSLDAALGDAGHDLCHVLWHNFADCDVVLEEQWFRATDNEVIHAHCHQVDTDGVVLVHSLGDSQLGAHAVGTCCEQRLTVLAECEQSGESAEAATNLRAGCFLG